MKTRRILVSLLVLSVLLLATAIGLTYAQELEPPGSLATQGTLGTAFTYQGQLKVDGEPVNDTCEIAFRLYDDATAGSQVGTAITATVAISDGLFTRPLDFGAGAFNGDARWLDIRVMCPGDSGFTDLGRQALTAAPYAQFASSTGALHGQPVTTTLPAVGQVLQWDGATWIPALDDDTTYAPGNQLDLTGTTFDVLEGTGSDLDADLLDGQHASAFALAGTNWSLTGNTGTVSTMNFLGTTDAQPLVLRTNNTEQARLDPSGNLGLGTDTPTERLTVRGNAHVLGEDNPAAQGYTNTNLDGPYSFYVSGRYAYVASTNNHRLAVFDVSDPNNIVALGYTSTNLDGPYSVYVSGRYAYVTSYWNNRLAVFDVSDPTNIVAVGFTSANLDMPISVYVSGRYAYVASLYNDRLAVFDVSDPNNIVALGYTSTNLDGPISVYVSGRYAYVASYTNNHLAVFDVSDPANIVALGFTSTYLNEPRSVYVSGRYAYIASSNNHRLVVFDVSDPNNIVALGFTNANLDFPISVYVSGRYAYVASFGNDRLAVFDVSDPANIVAKGYTNANLDSPRSVYVSGRYAYVSSSFNDRLVTFEVNNLEAPTLETGNLQSGYLDVTDNAIVGNNLHVQGGLNVGPSGALVGGDMAVEGDLQVVGNYIQFPTITGSAPPAADCDEASEAGRIVVRTDGTTNLYICTGATGWVGK
ncbi:MAG: beta-propeller fold lactonase family protein [Anaerolineae bacterium]